MRALKRLRGSSRAELFGNAGSRRGGLWGKRASRRRGGGRLAQPSGQAAARARAVNPTIQRNSNKAMCSRRRHRQGSAQISQTIKDIERPCQGRDSLRAITWQKASGLVGQFVTMNPRRALHLGSHHFSLWRWSSSIMPCMATWNACPRSGPCVQWVRKRRSLLGCCWVGAGGACCSVAWALCWGRHRGRDHAMGIPARQ